MRLQIISIALIVVCLFGCGTDIEKSLTKKQKIIACKHYISSLLDRDVNSLHRGYIKEIKGFDVEIIFAQSSDHTVWKNVCHIESDSMVWADIIDGEVGRWHFEDEVKLSLSNQKSTLLAGSLFSLKI